MTRTIGEGVRVVEEVNRHGRIFRLNTWFRFKDTFYGLGTDVKPLKKVIESGVLGWPLTFTVSGVTGYDWKFYWSGRTDLKPQPVPAELDYDMWLGPAPYKPYNPDRVHAKFRGYWDYDGGGLGDMGQHYLDPVQYLLGKDDTSPIRVDVDCPQQHYDAAGSWRRIEFTYADGCKIVLDGENKDTEAAYIAGPKGKIFRGFRSDIPNLQQMIAAMPDPEPQIGDVLRVGPLAAEVRAQRERTATGPRTHREPGRHRRAPRAHHPLRPGRAALQGRRGGQPPDRAADARAVGASRGRCTMHNAQRTLPHVLHALCVLASSALVARAAPRPAQDVRLLSTKVADILAQFPAGSAGGPRQAGGPDPRRSASRGSRRS